MYLPEKIHDSELQTLPITGDHGMGARDDTIHQYDAAIIKA
ncbi:hypothetical protein [Phytoactinopolyspora mesophila]|nr:hypothetical protein [Phytoactinopolyspora mesophila]